MKNLVVVVLTVAVVLGMVGGVAASEGEEHGEVTVRGEILDMACYVSHAAKGPDHAACAQRCVKGGQPMGLLVDDGTVYLLYADHNDSSAFDQAKDFAGKTVDITGKASSQNGIKGLEVHGVKAP